MIKKIRIQTTKEALQKRPDLKEEILDLYDLMEDEIEDGESEQNEFEKFENILKELLNE
jgi:hypothetical protein